MAGDLVPAKALVANLDILVKDLEDRYGAQGRTLRSRKRTAADSEHVGEYVVEDLRSLYAALLIRVNALQDSA